jgi:hypothetical protein
MSLSEISSFRVGSSELRDKLIHQFLLADKSIEIIVLGGLAGDF